METASCQRNTKGMTNSCPGVSGMLRVYFVFQETLAEPDGRSFCKRATQVQMLQDFRFSLSFLSGADRQMK